MSQVLVIAESPIVIGKDVLPPMTVGLVTERYRIGNVRYIVVRVGESSWPCPVDAWRELKGDLSMHLFRR